MNGDVLSAEDHRRELLSKSKEIDEKENKDEISRVIGSSGKMSGGNTKNTPSELTLLPSNNVNKNDFGPLSPVQLNIGRNRVSNERTLSKAPGTRSRQESMQKAVGVIHQHMVSRSANNPYYGKNTTALRGTKQDDDENSFFTEVAIHATEEEEEQLKRMMISDQNTGTNTSEKTILNQSKKLVGYLGGSIRTALQQNSSSDVPMNKPDGINNYLNNELRSLVETSIPDQGLIEAPSQSKGEAIQVTNVEMSPIPQPKSKYWETLMLRSEEVIDMKQGYCEFTSLGNEKNQTVDMVDNYAATNNETPHIGRRAFSNRGDSDGSNVGNRIENTPSPQSMLSVPEDYSPGEGATENLNSPLDKGFKSKDDNSPGSLMYNMISAATNIETPLICKSELSSTDKGDVIASSPAVSDFGNMISSSIETPLVWKSNPSTTGKSNTVYSSPTVSHFETTLSSAGEVQTHQLGLLFQNNNSCVVGESPDFSGFKNMHTKAGEKPTSNEEVEVKQILFSRVTEPVTKEMYPPNKMEKPLSCIIMGDSSEKTPLRSNTTVVIRRTESDSSLNSNCDDSEDDSIFTSLSPQASIKSNTPRSRRVMEWLDPNESNTISWPAPSMTTSIRSYGTPERQLPPTKHYQKPTMMGTGQYLNLQKQVRRKYRPSQISNLFVPRPLRPDEASPASLPSLLGSASINEISDLESPTILSALPLNFKFSDEESTIHSQSLHDTGDINSIPGSETNPCLASPQSLMTVATPTVGYPTDEETSYKKKFPNDAMNTHKPAPLTENFSLLTSNESISPHSTITDGSFKKDEARKEFCTHSVCLKRCVVFGMLVAVIGAITVLAVTSNNWRKEDQPTNIDEEWKTGNWRPTTRPTSNFDFPDQTATTASPVSDLESNLEDSPTTDHPLDDDAQFPTFDPISNSTDSPPPTSSPSLQLPPTSVQELDGNVSFQPTFEPTSKQIPTASFPNVDTENLTWDRFVDGEDIWRKSDGEMNSTPMWYHATDETPGIQLQVINAAKGERFSKQLRIATDDYSRSKSVSLEFTTVPYEVLCGPPKMGELKLCSGNFGDTDWIGSTILFMKEDFIVSALIRINERSLRLASDSLLQYVLCHQVGHTLGVLHNDAEFSSPSCMKDFGENVILDGNIIRDNEELQHPNSDDLDYLETLHGVSPSKWLRGR